MEKENLLWEKLNKTNLLPVAFLGDSIHTAFVRKSILEKSNLKMENYHSVASKYCKASSQSKVLEIITPTLNENEKEIVRRARNAKPKHQAKNCTTKDYLYATAFEALVGYLYLTAQTERLTEILTISINYDNN